MEDFPSPGEFIEKIQEENCEIIFDGIKGVIILRNNGRAILQISDSKGNQSDYIKLRYTGQPEILIRDIEMLYNNATTQNKLDDLTWIIDEFVLFFEGLENLKAVDIDQIKTTMLPFYEYSLKIGEDNWEFSYICTNNSYEFLKMFNNVDPIIIDFHNGIILTAKDLDKISYNKRIVIPLKIPPNPSNLKEFIFKDKMFIVLSRGVAHSAFFSCLNGIKDKRILQEHQQKVLSMSREYPKIISYNERYVKYFKGYFKKYLKR